jgi:hypothetical protein
MSDFEKMRDTLSDLRDALVQQVRTHGYDPRPGSPAAPELTSFPKPESLHTAHGQACMLTEVIGDQLTAFVKTITGPVETIAPYTCVRSLLEATALGCWLLDPAIDAQARAARSIAFRYEGLLQQKKWARAAGQDPRKAESRLLTVADLAIALGYSAIHDSHGKHCGAGTRMPSVTDLIRDVLDKEPLYRLLSAVAHGHHWASQQLGFTITPSHDAASPISGITLRGITKEANIHAMTSLVLESAVALARMTWYHGLYLGWDRESLSRCSKVILIDSVPLKICGFGVPRPNVRCSWRWAEERAEAFACAHVHRAVLYEPQQLNAIR